MQGATRILLCLLGAATLWMPVAPAASFDCNSPLLSRTEAAICQDARLARMDDQLARRLDSFRRRLSFGQYLGLRHWHAASARRRNLCRTDRTCIVESYRAQARFLDRLRSCVDASPWRRACLRDLLMGDRETMRR